MYLRTLPCRFRVLAPPTQKSLLQKLYFSFADTPLLTELTNSGHRLRLIPEVDGNINQPVCLAALEH